MKYPSFRTIRVDDSGMTLIEVMLYVAIVGSVLLALTGLFSLVVSSREMDGTRSEVESMGNEVVKFTSIVVRNGSEVLDPPMGTNSSVLSVASSQQDRDPTDMYIEDGVIYAKVGTGIPVALTSGRVIASDLIFEHFSSEDTSSLVRVSFTITHINDDGRTEYEYSKLFRGAAVLRSFSSSPI